MRKRPTNITTGESIAKTSNRMTKIHAKTTTSHDFQEVVQNETQISHHDKGIQHLNTHSVDSKSIDLIFKAYSHLFSH